MERGFESYSGIDPEREMGGAEFESTPEKEKTEADLLMEMFEDGRRFNDENAKEIDYNNRLDQADEYKKQVDEISEKISQATSQLAALPLTPEQLQIMDKIEQLIARRQQTTDPVTQAELDSSIEKLTKQFAALPVTDEQAQLLDSILELIDAREATSVKLRDIFNQ